MLLLVGRFEDAKARVAGLLAKNPKDVEALLLHANAIAALRDPAGAIAQIEEALKVNPDSSRAFVNLGAVRVQSGEAKEAEVGLSARLIAMEPSSLDAKLALASFLWAAERLPEAEASHQGGRSPRSRGICWPTACWPRSTSPPGDQAKRSSP